ncbi:hypothetical protein M0R88_08580 [Halorussus gelatinilyticus]|uniref:DUF7344 domain-containing protein n=1 Tax=Halorussus gelatinilyticus TaxID=2937524 RepID=A0A8U0IPS0_9EURY|nr:hypothetical protein [Halorussus gelatinilyticus]UPW02134.1 hypothetical protein M0R88_08580 [Halorussus gelatinilyticus]
MRGEGSTDTISGRRSDGEREAETQVSPSRLDDAFTALADPRRRRVVQYFLRTSDDVATVTDLARYVADRRDEDFESVSLALHHKDVAKLDEADVVEYDSRTETVRYVGSELVSDLLARADGDSDDVTATAGPDALEHLSDALTADDPVEKDYCIRQALQYVHFERGE